MLHVTCQHHLVSLEYLTLTKTALVDPPHNTVNIVKNYL